MSEQSTHALYQLTGALRNLAGGGERDRAFVSSGALAQLLAALRHHTDRDVLTNVARCLRYSGACSEGRQCQYPPAPATGQATLALPWR